MSFKKFHNTKTKNYFSKFPIESRKGSSLLFTILIMSFVMGISLGVSYLLFQEIKIMRDIGDSVVAFYAAESGMEKLMMSQTGPSGSTECFANPYSNICYETTVYTPGDSGCLETVENFCLQSIGNYGSTKRAIQMKY